MDLAVAMALLLLILLPLAFSFHSERKLARGYYHRAIADEIVDGEFEALLAGEWKQFPEGQQLYAVRCLATTNLPPGQFLFTRRGTTIRLEWLPGRKGQGGRVVREAEL
jgi:hypothetical protein